MQNMKTLAQMTQGQKANIIAINGGHGMQQKLDALGIHVGKQIEKVSTGIAHGPVVLRCGSTEVAIGFGMAQKIIVGSINTEG